MAQGWTEENLSARIQLLSENNARSRYLSQAEIESLMAACQDRQTQAFVAFAAYAGMRQGEVMALRAEDVTGGIIKHGYCLHQTDPTEVKQAGFVYVRIESETNLDDPKLSNHKTNDIADVCRLTCLEQGMIISQDSNAPTLMVKGVKVILLMEKPD